MSEMNRQSILLTFAMLVLFLSVTGVWVCLWVPPLGR